MRTAYLFALLSIGSAFGLLIAGCDIVVGDDGHGDMSPADAALDLAPAACAADCPPCALGETCLRSWVVDAPQFSARCLKTCNDDRDCTNGYLCIEVDNAFNTLVQPRVCMTIADPPPCGPVNAGCSEHGEVACDGDTLVRTFANFGNNVCGGERSHCKNGCAQMWTDMGLVHAYGGHCL